MTLCRRLGAEGLGSLLLAATVIGSGIMAERLASGNTAVALLANTGATVAVLAVLITLLAPVSGAHFNPAVSLVQALRKAMPWSEAGAYVLVQIAGCCAGALLAHAMFELPLLQSSIHVRAGPGPMAVRSGSNIRAAARDSRTGTSANGPLDGRRLDWRRILVHGIHVFCKPGHHHRQVSLGHLRRHSSPGRTGLRWCAVCRRPGRIRHGPRLVHAGCHRIKPECGRRLIAYALAHLSEGQGGLLEFRAGELAQAPCSRNSSSKWPVAGQIRS